MLLRRNDENLDCNKMHYYEGMMRIWIVTKCITKRMMRIWIVTKGITKKEWREFGLWQWTLNWILTKCITKKEWREFGLWQWTLNWIFTKCITKKEWWEFGPWQWTHYTELLTHPRTRGSAGRVQWSVCHMAWSQSADCCCLWNLLWMTWHWKVKRSGLSGGQAVHLSVKVCLLRDVWVMKR